MSRVIDRAAAVALVVGVVVWSVLSSDSEPPKPESDGAWVDSFDLNACTWSTVGKNKYFILEPGYQIELGNSKGERSSQVLIRVLKDTERIDGVETRVVEEREFKRGRLKEISRNFFAICEERNDVYYFGEDVRKFKKGKLVGHSQNWRAGKGGARAGLMMPGRPTVGFRHYQEVAPGVSMDRAEIRRSDDICPTTVGTFLNCLQVVESSALEPRDESVKRYAPGIGIIQDGDFRLIRYGHRPAGQMI